MASFDGSSAECSICTEVQKEPKLLPCTHSFCLQCLKQYVGNKTEFACPLCREVMKVPDRGLSALRDNPYIKELIEAKTVQTQQACSVHGTALTLFCDEPKCQREVCPSCPFAEHKGHKILDLHERREIICHNLRQKILEAKYHIEGWTKQKENIKEAKIQVQEKAISSLQAINDMKVDFNNHMVQLADLIDGSSQKEVKQIDDIRSRSIQSLSEYEKRLDENKNEIEVYIGRMKTMIESGTISALIELEKETTDALQNIFQRSSDVNSVPIKFQEPEFVRPNFQQQLKLGNLGESAMKEAEVKTPIKHACKTLIDVDFITWKGSKAAVRTDGVIVVFGKSIDNHFGLKCFDARGQLLWGIKMQKDDDDGNRPVEGLCFMSDKNKEFLVTSNNAGKELELRRLKDGKIKFMKKLQFNPDHICSDEGKTAYVINMSKHPRELQQIQLGGKKLYVKDFKIPIQCENPFGVCMYHDHRLTDKTPMKCVVITSWAEKSIQAINLSNGAVIWEIQNQIVLGKSIEPHGVCISTTGEIFVADGSNSRVLCIHGQNTSGGMHIGPIIPVNGSTVSNVEVIDQNDKKLVIFHSDSNFEKELISTIKLEINCCDC